MTYQLTTKQYLNLIKGNGVDTYRKKEEDLYTLSEKITKELDKMPRKETNLLDFFIKDKGYLFEDSVGGYSQARKDLIKMGKARGETAIWIDLKDIAKATLSLRIIDGYAGENDFYREVGCSDFQEVHGETFFHLDGLKAHDDGGSDVEFIFVEGLGYLVKVVDRVYFPDDCDYDENLVQLLWYLLSDEDLKVLEEDE